eukprot:9502666-Pyramimonas_sp.AAC.1
MRILTPRVDCIRIWVFVSSGCHALLMLYCLTFYIMHITSPVRVRSECCSAWQPRTDPTGQ